MKSFLKLIGRFICGTIKFAKNIIFVSYLFLLVSFVLTVIMPSNVLQAIDIAKNLLRGIFL